MEKDFNTKPYYRLPGQEYFAIQVICWFWWICRVR